MRRPVQIVMLGIAIAVLAAAPPSNAQSLPLDSPKSQMHYVLAAHPDDEVPSWPVIASLPSSTYTVFVAFTKGEGTDSCRTAEEAEILMAAPENPTIDFLGHWTWVADTALKKAGQEEHTPVLPAEKSTGPYKYEGPNSPVGEPDFGEREPLGFPWVGSGTPECGDARVASWHWFLDDAHHVDGAGTDLAVADDPRDDDDYRGRRCAKGGGQKIYRCAEVWASHTGARVVFNFGDAGIGDAGFLEGRFDASHVTAAFQTLRANRAAWEIRVLPESGVFAAPAYIDPVRCRDMGQGHPDHKAVQDAVRYMDQGAGVQQGRAACADDPYRDGAEAFDQELNPATLVAWNLVDPVTSRRLGPLLENWGWLMPGYQFDGCLLNCHFWRRID